MTSTTQAQNPSAQQASKKLDALRQEALSLSRQEVRKIEVVDTDFVITTRSGQKLIVRDGALRTMMHPNFSLVFTDGPIRGQQILQNAEAFDMDAVARLTGRDAGAVQASDEAKPQAPKPQGEEAGKTVQQAKALGQDPNAGQDPINPERAAADGSSTASTAEGQAAKAPAPEPAVETVAATPASVATSSSGFFANINPAWGALGALGAAGGGGGGEGNVTNYITQAATGGSTADPTTETKLVKALLNVVLGEVNSKLNYVIRSTTGETLAQGTTESVDGQFSLTLQTNYTGPVEITITDFSTSDGLGYRDEATGLSKNLDVPVRAIAVLKADALNTINVTPVTELVVDWLYHPLGGNSSLTELTEEKVTQGNAKVAKALGLVDGDGKAIDLTGLVGLSALNDTTAPSGIEALAYAQVLAALSGYDATAGGSFSKTLAEMSANLRSIKSGDTSPAVVTLISRGALLAMDNMVESGNYSALAARDFISKIFTGVEGTVSSVGLASILFDSSVKWIKKGRTNTLLLNFRDAVKAQTILDNLTFDGVAAKTFGITLADLRLSTTATSSPNANTSNKQWVLTLNGDLDAIKDDADKLITVEYKSVVGNVTTASNQVILKVGSVSPIVESSGLLGSTGTRIPTYEVVSEEGLVDVTVTLIDEKGIEQTFKLKASANRPKVYTYTLSLSEALAPGTYSVKVSLTDQFGNVSNNQTGSGFTLVGQPVTFLLPKDDTGWTESLDAQGHEIANAVSLTDNKTKFREFTYVVKTIAGAEVLVTINNQEFKATESKTVPGWFEVTFYDLPDGVYLPKVKVKDLIAYATSHLEYTGTTVVVDTQPPVLKPELSSVQEGNPDQETVLTITLPTADTGTVQGQARAVKFWDGLSGDDLQHFSWADATHSKLIFRGVTDFEAKSTYTITLTAYDEVGNGITQNFTVRVTNLNEAPTVTQAISESLTEDSGGDAQGWVSFDLLKNASDPDLAAAANNEVLSVDVSRATYSVDASTVSAWPSGLAQVEGKTLKFNINHASLQALRAGETRVFTLAYAVRDKAGLSVNQTATFTVRGTNDRPVLDASLALILAATATTATGASAPVGETGNGVSDFTSSITDADGQSLKGLAITGVATGAKLWYSINGGRSWTEFKDPSDTHALLLNGDANNRVFVQAGPGLSAGTSLVSALTFKGWDQTDGKASGSTVTDTSGSAYSSTALGVSQRLTLPMDASTAQAFEHTVNTTSGARLSTTKGLSLAIGDFNQDGRMDFYAPWAGTAVADAMYLNAGTDSGAMVHFSEQTVAAGNVGSILSTNFLYFDQLIPHTTTLDVDNDGDLDIAMVSSNANAALLLNEGQQQFVNAAWASGLVKQRASASSAVLATYGGQGLESMVFADFNGDGFVDVAWSNATSGLVSVLANKGNGTFDFDNAWAIASGASSSGRGSLLWGDFNGDGVLDLLVGSETLTEYHKLYLGSTKGYAKTNLTYLQAGGQNELLQLVDARTLHPDFAGATAPYVTLSNVRLSASSMTTADFDQDGHLDLFLGEGEMGLLSSIKTHDGLLLHHQPGTATVSTNSGSSTTSTWSWLFERASADLSPQLTGKVRTSAWMDYNMDGWLDLITSEVTSAGNGIRVYLSKGKSNGVFQGFHAGLSASDTGLDVGAHTALGFNVADLDGNGTPDLLVSTDAGVALFLNRQMPTTHLSLNVLGKTGLTPLYGAKVVVTQQDDPTQTFTQFVQGDTGEGTNQGELTFYGLNPDKTYDVAITYAFDADTAVNGYDSTAFSDTGIELVSVTSKFLGIPTSAEVKVLRVDPSNKLEVGAETANQFVGWNPVTAATDENSLQIVNGGNEDDAFDVDPAGARIYRGGLGHDQLTFTNASISGVTVSLLTADETGVTGVLAFAYNSATNLYTPASPFLFGSDSKSSPTAQSVPSDQIRAGIDFTGINALTMTSNVDTVLDNVGLSNIVFGEGNDKLVLTQGAVLGDRQSIVYDGGAGTGDSADFGNLDLGNVRLRFEWVASATSDAGSEGEIQVYKSTQNAVWASLLNFEAVTGTASAEVFDYRGRLNAASSMTINGSDDVWYGTKGSAKIATGDKFNITLASKYSQGVKIYNGGMDDTYLGTHTSDALYMDQKDAYFRVTAVETTDTNKFGIQIQSGDVLNGTGWFSGLMDDAQGFYFSNFKAAAVDLSKLSHGAWVGFQTQANSVANVSMGDAQLIGTAFDDKITLGHYNYGSGRATIEAGRGNDFIEIDPGRNSPSSVPANETAKFVFKKYSASDRLFGNGTDEIKGFGFNLNSTLDLGEDILDFSGFGLSITTKEDMSKYFKAVKISAYVIDIRFDQDGMSNFADTNTLVKLSGLSVGTYQTNDFNALMWTLKTAGQVVI